MCQYPKNHKNNSLGDVSEKGGEKTFQFGNCK